MSVLCSMVGASFTVAAVAQVLRSKKGITAVGNAQVDTAQSKFGGSSFLGDGNGDYLQLGTYSDLSLTGTFTIECWFRIPGTVPSILPFYNSDHLFYLTTGAVSGGRFAVFQGGSNRYLSNDVTVSANTWYHIAFVRDSSSNITAYLNGVNTGNANPWGVTIDNTTPTIGAYSPHFLNGHIDEYRISNSARYTANFTPATAAFVNDANTLLLIHANGTDGSTFFEDDNGVRAQRGITAVGNAQVDTAQSKFGGASALFDGTGDYLLIDPTNSSSLNFGTGDFTIEFWARNTNRDAFHTVIANNKSSWTAGSVTILGGSGSTSTTALRLAVNSFNSGGAGLVHDNQAMTLGVWYHYAIVRSGNNFTMYRDGTSVSTGTFSGSINLGEDGTRVGYTRWDGDVSTWDGHLDEIRVSNSVRYTAAFTAPTEPFVNDANTVLLLHMDGTDGSTVFRDDNGALANRQPKYITAVGNAQIDAGQSKFGEVSAQFDGTSDYLTIANGGFNVGTGDITIEYWVRHSAINDQQVYSDFRVGGGNHYIIYLTSGNKIQVYDGASTYTGTTSLAANTWYHIALSRSGTNLKVFLNGTQEISDTNSRNLSDNGVSVIGSSSDFTAGNSMNGHMDEIRVSNVARYTANFTPSTVAFTNDANTLLLIHADGVDATTQFYDDTGNRMQKGISAVGNAQIDTAQSYFGGASAQFDGTDDYLLLSSYPDLNFGTNNFTIEFWIRANSVGNDKGILTNGNATFNTGTAGIAGGTLTAGVRLYSYDYNSSGSGLVRDPAALPTGVWYHYAIVRLGNNFTLYRNGTSVSTGSWTGSFNFSSNGTLIGKLGNASGSAYSWDGHMDEIRISNTARYTANFTPSTTPFQNDANTLLLLHMDGTDGSTVFTDDNGIAPYTP